ncbi:MAG: glycosyl hydrolase family 28-related protein [Puia sp.]|nr:glycosyl hydrolase family 28-related protein [Puia sp.]
MKVHCFLFGLAFLCQTLTRGQTVSPDAKNTQNSDRSRKPGRSAKLISSGKPGKSVYTPGSSFYRQRLEDEEALYFTPDKYKIRADGSMDVSDALQGAINELKTEHNFGVLFIPEGTYLISKTIYIPRAVRLIGYGAKRPLIVLAKNAPGFRIADPTDKGQAKYMFWFISDLPKTGNRMGDAGASTFYSALSNINLKIEDGNPVAVALRTHFAQHSFISHADIFIGRGKAGMFDVGNEMEDVRFFGGDFGIYTTKPSPGWQFMMVDTWFEGQRVAAIQTREGGLTIVRMHAKNTPAVIDIVPNFHERLFMEDCQWENISGPALTIGIADNATDQISLRNIDCRNVPIAVAYRQTSEQVPGAGPVYTIRNFMHGLQMDSLHAEPVVKTIRDFEARDRFPAPVPRDIPDFPAIESWINLRSLGAKGDGITDDTKVIQAAIDQYPAIYIPTGWYRVSETIHLKPNTALIGLNPIATQFILANNTEAFGSFGAPKPLLETAKNGTNIVSGIGLSTNADNPRAVACKWTAGAGSYMNDVKFIGGHGGMDRIWKQPPSAEKATAYRGNGVDPSWDTQYWSLWITDGGGGTFKDIWTANTYAGAGAYISNTNTPGHIYAMSIEHHVRNEIRLNKVTNWKIYALQLEEESREGTECQPMELADCHDMVFANLYMFRVIRIIKPYPYSIRNWGSDRIEFLNVHNYSQIKYTTSLPLYDINTNTQVRPWEFSRLYIGEGEAGGKGTGPETAAPQPEAGLAHPVTTNSPIASEAPGAPGASRTSNAFDEPAHRLATGFEFAEGICSDSKGNVYFCDSRLRRIYRWSSQTNTIHLLADYPWEPLSLACDKNDNLLVVFKYTPKPGYLRDGRPEVYTNPPDAAGTSFSGWGNSGFGTLVYAVDPGNPDETIRLLEKVKMGSVNPVYKALYPAHRWRDYHDFNTVTVNRPEECFLAPDKVTIIPVVYDLARSACLAEAFPGKPLYVTDEYDKRTVQLTVSPGGFVSDMRPFVEKGEFGSAVDAGGKVYVADGQIYIYDPSGRQTGEIRVPERPTTIVPGNADKKTLYITGANGLYSQRID